MNKQLLAGIVLGGSVVLGGVFLTAATPVNTDPVVTDQSTIVVPTTEPTEPAPSSEPTEPTPTPEPGDSVYTPSTDDCGPDGYRIEPGTCEWYDVEIGEAITVECDLEYYVLDESGNCVDIEIIEPAEDTPEFDCRIHGNHTCGVEIEGVWYILNFDTNTFQDR